MSDLTLQTKLENIIAEYDYKIANVENALKEFEQAADALKTAACVQGTYGQVYLDTGRVHAATVKESITKSAWLHLYSKLNIERIATANDKRNFERSMSAAPEFTLENIKASLGDYVLNPWENILRGLAETFCTLDQSYKSHEKVKIGVKGLPKRVIIGGFHSYSGYGKDRLRDVLNALAAYQNKPLVTYQELNAIIEDGNALLKGMTIADREGKEKQTPPRGVTLKIFQNGNGHLFFEPDTLRDINKALAEYYGDVLPDCHTEQSNDLFSTEVAKDLQYYPTPSNVINSIVRNDIYIKDKLVLEPSCGCGRIMDAIRDNGGKVHGIEIDPKRAAEAKAKGHHVHQANFLEVPPKAEYDLVIMNPPFYGKHYAKHVAHALKFLKDGGTLIAILPATARYDHGLLDGRWYDLPVGSFKESGTNVNTSVLTIRK